MKSWLRLTGPNSQADGMGVASGLRDLGERALATHWRYLFIFLFFFAIAVGQGVWSLRAPFESDDLHLIRVYSGDELARSFRGHWDPDAAETPGFRPLTALFNHLRAWLFGESVVGHRLFLLGLFSFYVTLLVVLADMLRSSYWEGLLAGVLVLLHTTSVYHYAWISDGVHLLSGIFIIASLLSLLLALQRRNYWWIAPSVLFVALALLTREDSLVVYPLSLLVAVAFITKRKWWPRFHTVLMGLHATALIVILGVFWGWRSIVVPQASGLGARGLTLYGFLWSVLQTVEILGDPTHLIVWWLRYIWLIWLWTVCLGAIGVIFLFLTSNSARLRAALWLGCLVVAATPGLVVPRINTLLVPVTFFGLFVATVVVEFSRRSRPSLALGLAISLFAVSSSYYGSMILQRERSSTNLDHICRAAQVLYDNRITVPEVRRPPLEQRLGGYGIHSSEDLRTALPELIEDARLNGRYGPNEDGLPFIPRFRFVMSPDWREWSCVAKEGWLF